MKTIDTGKRRAVLRLTRIPSLPGVVNPQVKTDGHREMLYHMLVIMVRELKRRGNQGGELAEFAREWFFNDRYNGVFSFSFVIANLFPNNEDYHEKIIERIRFLLKEDKRGLESNDSLLESIFRRMRDNVTSPEIEKEREYERKKEEEEILEFRRLERAKLQNKKRQEEKKRLERIERRKDYIKRAAHYYRIGILRDTQRRR